MSNYNYTLKTKNKNDMLSCLSYMFWEIDEGKKVEDVEEANITIEQKGNEYIATIEYIDVIIIDLPNLYDGVECMYDYCKEIVLETNACPFKFSFHMSSDHGDYFHVGECTFDGKTITYFDNASVDCMEPAEASAKAEYKDGNFCNEEKEFELEFDDCF